jgi:PAS domain S-box-containing protein
MALYKHQAERKLRESEERFRLAAVAAHAMVYDIDVRTKRVNAMSGLAGLLGFEEREADMTLDWWGRQIHPDDLPAFQAAFQKMHAEPRDGALEYRLKRKDGRTLFVEDHATPVRDRKGQLTRIVGTVVDITARKEAENGLRRANAELSYSNQCMVGRELRMIELKKEVDELCRQFGQPTRYKYTTPPAKVTEPPPPAK